MIVGVSSNKEEDLMPLVNAGYKKIVFFNYKSFYLRYCNFKGPSI